MTAETTTPTTPTATEAPKAKKPRKAAPRAKASNGKPALIDAAAALLKGRSTSLTCREIIDALKSRKIWSSKAPTPHDTLRVKILFEERRLGRGKSRFHRLVVKDDDSGIRETRYEYNPKLRGK
jgi:hypothetical protein